MLAAISFLIISLTLFILLTDKITARIIRNEQTVIEINLTVFALRLTMGKKSKTKAKRKKRRKKNRFPAFIQEIIKRSKIQITELIATIQKKEPAIDAFRYGTYSSAIGSALVYLQNNAKFFSSSDIIINYSEHNKSNLTLTAELEISVFQFLICVFAYLIGKSKRILKI